MTFHIDDLYTKKPDEKYADFHVYIAQEIVNGINALLIWSNSSPAEAGTPENWEDILKTIRDGFQDFLIATEKYEKVPVSYYRALQLFSLWHYTMWD